jgi:hypothetical protein
LIKKAVVAAAVVIAGALVVIALRRAHAPDTPSAPAPAPLGDGKMGAGGRATVTVYDEGRPVGGRWVVFHDAAGTVTSMTKSSAEGRASGPVTRGSMITVADPSSVHRLLTVQDIEPDDALTVGEMEDEEGQAITACTARVAIPNAHPLAIRHVVSLGVGATEVPDPKKPLPMPVLRRFIVDGRFTVLAEALDAQGKAVAFSHARPERCGDGGSVDVRLPAWSTDFRPFSIVVSGGAEGTSSIAAELSVINGEDRFARGRQEMALKEGTTFRFETPRPLGSNVTYKLAVTHGGSVDRSVLVERSDAMPDRSDVDLRGRLLPRVQSATLEQGSTPARPAARWSVSGSGPKADGTVVRFWWPSTREHAWTIVASPDAGARVVAPALPDELAAFRPDGRGIAVAAAIVEASFLDGYRDMKRNGLALLADPPHAPVMTVRYSAFGDLDF